MDLITLDKADIMALIPHRDPMFFLDSISILSEKQGRATAIWKQDHPVFKGHFPNFPIVPGIFLIEAAAQLASVISAYQFKKNAESEKFKGKDPYEYVGVLSGIRKTLIHKPVFPDQEVVLTIKLVNPFKQALMGVGKGYVDDQKVCTFELMFAVAKKEKLQSYLHLNG